MTERYVPLDEATTATAGKYRAIVDHWWIYRPGLGIVFAGLQSQSPQCNIDRRATEMIQSKLYPDAKIIQVPIVFTALPSES